MRREDDFPEWEVYSIRDEETPDQPYAIFGYRDEIATMYDRRHLYPDEMAKCIESQSAKKVKGTYVRKLGVQLSTGHTYYIVLSVHGKNELGEMSP